MFNFISKKSEVYKESVKLYMYNEKYFRLIRFKALRQKGFEDEKKNKTGFKNDEENQRTNLSHTKSRIRELALANSFEYFATITVNSDFGDRFHLDEVQNLLKKQIRNIRLKNPNFKYLFITEKHKNGAFHFHGLVKNCEFYINKNGYLSNEYFDRVGFNSFLKIDDRKDSYSKVCNYIAKYITKDCVKNSAGSTYISSRGLKKADVFELPINFQFEPTFSNDFLMLKDFTDEDYKENLKIFLT